MQASLMTDTPPALPIDEVLAPLRGTLARGRNAVLVAPPGAGKTTRVPLALLGESWVGGRRIVMLEPRRLAAQGAAARMAETLSEPVGETVGLRVRLGSKVSARTRIEVVTEGVFARMILDDPELAGIAVVIFDEFHERSLDADFGLALALDAQAGLREDLRILVMSATLDGARVAGLLGAPGAPAPVIESEGRAFPVETRYRGRDPARRLEEEVAAAVRTALASEPGSILVFLPGQGEIRRTEALLEERFSQASAGGQAVDIAPLYGQLDRAAQNLAIRPSPAGRRKVVLATSIAETSLTIDGVRVVIDSGLARVPRFEPDIGITRLETVRASRAAADQRRGRAGRTEPGVCIRLWEEAATGALAPFSTPEILSADLAPLLLDCAAWGIDDPARLPFLDPPPAAAVTEARKLLQGIGALDARHRLTDTGRALQALPLPPRLARMVVEARRGGRGAEAAEIAAVLVERGLGGNAVDITERVGQFRRDRSPRAGDMRRLARNWAGPAADATRAPDPGPLLALAFPDRIARARAGDGAGDGIYVLANGRGATLDPADPLARETWLAVAEITGSAASARIVSAAPLTPEDVETLAGDMIVEAAETTFDTSAKALRSRRTRRLGAIVLDRQPLPVKPDESAAAILARGIAGLGVAALPWTKALTQWRTRVAFLRKAEGADLWPDLSDEALAATVETWLTPHLVGLTGLAQIDTGTLDAALKALLPWDRQQQLERDAPTHFTAPTGSRIPVDYSGDNPSVAVRVQELFGLAGHPAIANGRLPLTLELLSPAHRPIQITRDLPGFWRGSWTAVRAEMRGRYPRHVWPEDPASATATTRAKPRGI
ncbi:ATP-dependent helicase HrpB [Pseudochelatococcus lubricantis]|uniref:ATP-dependent helicase HrpB n=2 Tax=Pseudochelatococcus lubricantis TaxID=1538102 RepID=A0ABX0UUD1_9HYPH|nr:ATP-dependent helicase HrpB [Pseudochelatococcus lubricantis]